jgi:hypothetical protein
MSRTKACRIVGMAEGLVEAFAPWIYTPNLV